MSRQIKFRAWDGKRMTLSGIQFVNTSGELVAVDGYLMQWTGLTDKNSTPIYEGDLLINSRGRIGEVVWHDYTASFDAKFVRDTKPEISSSMGLQNNMWGYSVEVIGNIYQHKELMEPSE
jgi:uncharacterized phage protein (TIGR01671 family)